MVYFPSFRTEIILMAKILTKKIFHIARCFESDNYFIIRVHIERCFESDNYFIFRFHIERCFESDTI